MTTTREAALEAALKLANVQMNLSLGDWNRISSAILAALSTPATEPQGYVEITEEMIVAGRKAADDQYYKWRGFGPREEGQGLDGMHFIVSEALRAALAARPAPQPAAEHEYPDPLIAEDRYEDDQPAVDTPAMNDELATMISDLSHTGELSMPYRLEIAEAARYCRPENYASGVQCQTCGQSWGEDGPEQCPNAALAGQGE